ncbi:Flagellar motility protein MotE, a chaperone for MotC folding [Methylobacterium phyllostachyos]|uniref:Flagellar motility protein MotE, a chaperone for MotC folding n=1 Tax=Methylobacterium phyllostachyos TaxID=582672 RepID=A0A1H0B7F0_9HYPH|nr:MotE family protein [Methylobacterium phyllostachyos]SDN41567.1 Flagellar motility protein MotE, a chaperone for MotC folding [Methylobacterium phyllostachyos]
MTGSARECRIGGDGRRFRLGLALAVAVLPVAPARAQPKPPEEAQPSQYCAGIANAAADARFNWQKDTLAALAKDVEARIGQLEAKRAEYEAWLKRRQAFLAKADESVTAIYAKMRPEAASQQLTAMDSEAAAAILTRLEPRVASAIMNEMDPGRAARLANVITNTPPKDPVPFRPDDTPKTPPEARPDSGDRRPQNSEKSG